MTIPSDSVLNLFLLAIGAALGLHFLILFAIPYVAMWGVMRRVTRYVGLNCFAHVPQPTAKNRDVVRPSPDLIYSIAVFDVSRSPLQISVPAPPAYMSLSLYAANTDNFYVVNDQQFDSAELSFVLAKSSSVFLDQKEVRVIQTPTSQGIILLRYFAANAEALSKINPIQEQVRITLHPLTCN
ncbi:MAG: DUF1254 domain-containing protein [Synechococcaceae cyanobacterium SM2_3_1]|nr:DUF1254 domain-containing protein [Synechococcaceae cyanobacterium SM2_3_1]